jgi:hypothetical protein
MKSNFIDIRHGMYDIHPFLSFIFSNESGELNFNFPHAIYCLVTNFNILQSLDNHNKIIFTAVTSPEQPQLHSDDDVIFKMLKYVVFFVSN